MNVPGLCSCCSSPHGALPSTSSGQVSIHRSRLCPNSSYVCVFAVNMSYHTALSLHPWGLALSHSLSRHWEVLHTYVSTFVSAFWQIDYLGVSLHFKSLPDSPLCGQSINVLLAGEKKKKISPSRCSFNLTVSWQQLISTKIYRVWVLDKPYLVFQISLCDRPHCGRWRNWGLERLSDLPKFSQFIRRGGCCESLESKARTRASQTRF